MPQVWKVLTLAIAVLAAVFVVIGFARGDIGFAAISLVIAAVALLNNRIGCDGRGLRRRGGDRG